MSGSETPGFSYSKAKKRRASVGGGNKPAAQGCAHTHTHTHTPRTHHARTLHLCSLSPLTCCTRRRLELDRPHCGHPLHIERLLCVGRKPYGAQGAASAAATAHRVEGPRHEGASHKYTRSGQTNIHTDRQTDIQSHTRRHIHTTHTHTSNGHGAPADHPHPRTHKTDTSTRRQKTDLPRPPQIIVNSVLKGARNSLGVLMLVFIVYVIFGGAAVQLWQSVLRNRCYDDAQVVNGVPMRPGADTHTHIHTHKTNLHSHIHTT